MPDNATSKQPIIVISNSAAGGTGAGKDKKEDTFKLGNTKVPVSTIIKVGGLLAVAGIGYYAFTQLPAVMDYIASLGAGGGGQSTSGAAVSGASATVSAASVVSTYPGTGAGSFPAPSIGAVPGATGAYPYTTQPYPTTYPYQMAPSTAVATQTPMPQPLGIVQSYHAHITDHEYLDHRGKRRKFINELHIEEVVGSDEETERVLSLNEE